VAVIAGGHVSVRDESGRVVRDFGVRADPTASQAVVPLRIEAEPVGTIQVRARRADAVADLAAAILHGVYRRKLLVGVYQETLSGSYEELLERNRELSELAASLEGQVRARTRELAETQARLAREEKASAIGRLAAGVAHELNTPLACVRSNLTTLLDMFAPEGERAQIMHECIEMTDRAAGIVRDLRGFAHVDALGEVEIDVNEEIERVLARTEIAGPLKIERDYGALPPVRVNGRHLSLALLHLLENACEAAGEGGRVRITTDVEDGFAVLSIGDDGPGIPSEIVGRVFDPFFTTKEVGRGAGLGLTVARDIARAHGGDVALTCPSAGGTVARLSIPVAGAGDSP